MCEECWLSDELKRQSIDIMVDTQKVLEELGKAKLEELGLLLSDDEKKDENTGDRPVHL